MRTFNYENLPGGLLIPEVCDLLSAKLNKSQRIRMLFERKVGKVTNADIVQFCPDISVSFIERTLKQMLENGEIRKVGAARSTAYVKR